MEENRTDGSMSAETFEDNVLRHSSTVPHTPSVSTVQDHSHNPNGPAVGGGGYHFSNAEKPPRYAPIKIRNDFLILPPETSALLNVSPDAGTVLQRNLQTTYGAFRSGTAPSGQKHHHKHNSKKQRSNNNYTD